MNKLNFKILPLGVLMAALVACAPKKEDDSKNAILAMDSHLKSVEQNFVPESITDTGSGVAQTQALSKADDDICKGVDFIQCQPRLIRAYMMHGRAAVGLARALVTTMALHLAGVEDGKSGTVEDTEKGLTIHYTKRAVLDFDLIVLKGTTPVGRISAAPALYTIQFDIGVLDADKPESRGGKLEIQVTYTDHAHWYSRLSATDQKCMEAKPEDPTTGRIQVSRNGDLWSGQAMFYNGISAAFGSAKTCSAQPSDDTSLVVYTDFVADQAASKAALYMFKRNQSSTEQIQNFGLNNFCENYSDYCQSLATALNTTPAVVDQTLNSLTNPFCVRRGSPEVVWNSTCQNISSTVSESPFLGNSNWIAPAEFSKLSVQIPAHL